MPSAFGLLSLAFLLLPAAGVSAESERVQFVEGRCMSSFSNAALPELRALLPELEGYSDKEVLDALGEISGFTREEAINLGEVSVDISTCPKIDYPTASLLLSSKLLSYLELDQIVSVTSNDASYGSLWGVHGPYGANAVPAWDEGFQGEGLVVAVVDSGVDHTHPDLQANMWRNTAEIAGNGVDDDGNGYIDDIHGWNAISNSGNSFDDNSHGTHCAGTIAAVKDNTIGIAGIAPKAEIMAVKFLSASGSGMLSHAVNGLAYVLAQKQRGVNVRVTNNSWGGGGYSFSLRNAILAHQNAGIMFVAAAGNDSNNNDSNPSYPASYTTELTNIFVVAAHGSNSAHAYFTNYGATTVDLSAPGVSILSTVPGNRYASYQGTSMAAPHVSGAVAVLWGANPNLSIQQIETNLRAQGKNLPSFGPAILASQKGLDLGAALDASSPNEPPTLAAIPDQHFPAEDQAGIVTANVSDADGSVVSCSATVLSANGQNAIQFHQAFSPYCASVTCEEGVHGEGKKRLYSSTTGAQFILNSSDEVYLVADGERSLVGTFEGAYEEPKILTETPPSVTSLEHTALCTLTDDGTAQVALSWPELWWGSYAIRVTITDNEGASTSRTFTTYAESDPPTIENIPDQTVTLASGTATIPFTASDPDGDAVLCSATRQAVAVNSFSALADTYQPRCITDGCVGPNGTKLFIAADSSTLILNPQNALFRHAGGTVSQLGVFTSAFENPSLLISPARSANIIPITAAISESNIQLNFSSAGTGPFQVTLTCASVGGTTSRAFRVNITSTPATISKSADTSSYPGEAKIFPVTVGNGEGATTLTASIGRNFAAMALQIKQNHNPTHYYEHLDGWNGDGGSDTRKFLYNSSQNTWFNLERITDALGNELITFSTYPAGTILGTFPKSYWENPTKFITPAGPITNTTTTSVEGSTLRLSSTSAQSNGEVEVVALATKGHYRTFSAWTVEFKNDAPQVAFEAEHTTSGASSSVTVPVVVSDPDGQPLSVQVENVVDLSTHLAELVSARKLEVRPTNSTINGGYWLYSASHGWHAVTPSGANESAACLLRSGTVSGNILAVMPSGYCTDSSKILGSVGSGRAPSAELVTLTESNYDVTINTDGAYLTRVTLSIFDGITHYFAHIFVSNSNRAPQISGSSQAVARSGVMTQIPLTVTDPDGDGVQHQLAEATFCSSRAQSIVSELGLRYHANCSAASNECETNGVKYLYSAALKKVIYLLQRNGRAILSHDSRARNVIAIFPVSYYHMPERLVEAVSLSETPNVTLSSTASTNFDVSVTSTRDVCVKVETTDGALTARHDVVVQVSNILNGNGSPLLDTDGDGVSDEEEITQQTNPYDAGDASYLLLAGKTFHGIAYLLPNTELSGNLTNLGSSPASLIISVLDQNGSTLATSSRTLSVGDHTIPLYTSGVVAQAVQVVLSVQTGQFIGHLQSKTKNDDGEMIHSAASQFSFMQQSSTLQIAFNEPGKILIANLLNSSNEARVRVFNAAGEEQFSESFEIGGKDILALSLSELTSLSAGSIRIEGVSLNAVFLSANAESPLTSFTAEAISGSGASNSWLIAAAGTVGFEESARLTLSNALLRAISVTVQIRNAANEVVGAETVRLTPQGTAEFDLSTMLIQEGFLTLTLAPDTRSSLVSSLFRTLSKDDQTLAKLQTTLTGDASADTLWQELALMATEKSNSGSEEPGELAPGDVPKITYETPEKTGSQFRATIAYLDTQGRPLQSQSLQICTLKQGRKIRCSSKTVQTNQSGQVQITAKKKKLQRMYLRDQHGNLIRVWQKKSRR